MTVTENRPQGRREPPGDTSTPPGTPEPAKTRALRVRHSLCRDGQPLCDILNPPAPDAEMRPDQMRALGAALFAAASDADVLIWTEGLMAPITLEYDL